MTESSTEQDARTEPEVPPRGAETVGPQPVPAADAQNEPATVDEPEPAAPESLDPSESLEADSLEAGSLEAESLEADDLDAQWLDGDVPEAVSDAADPVEPGSSETAADSDSEDPEDPEDLEADEAPISGEALLVQEGEIAGDYLEQLLDILDYDGDIDLDVEGSRAIVAIVGANDLDPLVGARGVTLDALQELTRLTVAQQTGVRTRLMLDIGGYRAGRRTELGELAATSVTKVIDTGETVRMSPMNAFERKIVHDVVTATDGVRSESEGEDPDRRVVILRDR